MAGPFPAVAPSFRDPAGAVIHRSETIYRVIGSRGVPEWTAFRESRGISKLVETGRIVQTRQIEANEADQLLRDPIFAASYNRIDGQALLEHERIPFPSYPYEWAPEMLHAAGELTISLAQSLLEEGVGIKDASPYNVMFRGPDPVFIDILSFERRNPNEPTWLAYAQFVRTFILPLLASRELGIPIDQILLARRDGLDPEDLHRSLGSLKCLKPPLFGMVLMPALLSSRATNDGSIYKPKLVGDPEKARFMLSSTYSQLERALRRAGPVRRSSAWSEYMQSNNYSGEHFAAKESFVKAALEEFKPARVLDVGCNTGHFSLMAAKTGSVVSIDYDPVVVGEVWNRARREKAAVLPLVVNLTRPTPATGWRNQECSGFLDRARGHFDCVMMLAVIHHMLVTERIPIEDIVAMAAELTRDLAIIEFIGPGDSMFQRILRGRDELHAGLDAGVFELACQPHFEIVRKQKVEHTHRCLYLLRRRRSPDSV